MYFVQILEDTTSVWVDCDFANVSTLRASKNKTTSIVVAFALPVRCFARYADNLNDN